MQYQQTYGSDASFDYYATCGIPRSATEEGLSRMIRRSQTCRRPRAKPASSASGALLTPAAVA